MSDNFGISSRDMGKAGTFVAKNAAQNRNISFLHAANLSAAWQIFTAFAKADGVNKMEFVTSDLVLTYGTDLADQVEDNDLATSSAHNYLSAVNTIMRLATKEQWHSISPTKDCSIPRRSFLRTEPPAAVDRAAYQHALDAVRVKHGDRGATIVELCRELGLRSKEASLLKARQVMTQIQSGQISIIDGTKGGRERTLPILTKCQIDAIQCAAAVQGTDRSMIPTEQSWKTWRGGYLRAVRETLQDELNGEGLHDLRSSYACERYAALTGFSAPVFGGDRPDRETDLAARLQIAQELGHNRVDVTNSYCGGRK